MYAALYRYLILYKELPVPGIGTFLLQRDSAVADFPNKIINPPKYHVALAVKETNPSTGFFKWLSMELGLSVHDAVRQFNDFVFDLKKQIAEGSSINWNVVGVLQRELGGETKFLPAEKWSIEAPVSAEKVIRQKAEHMVRVGEDERTSDEMTAMLTRTESRRSYWWAAPLVIGLLCVMFIGWYFSEYGVDTAATGNHKLLTPESSPVTYKLLP